MKKKKKKISWKLLRARLSTNMLNKIKRLCAMFRNVLKTFVTSGIFKYLPMSSYFSLCYYKGRLVMDLKLICLYQLFYT